MLNMSYDDLVLLINAIKDQKYNNDTATASQRVANVKIDSLVMQLKDLETMSISVSWFTGYPPRVSISEDIGFDIIRVKNLLEHVNG